MRIALLLLATPLAAQEAPTSAEVLADFAARCAEIAADPRAAVNALADAGSEAVGGMTSDGAVAQVSEPLALVGDLQVLLSFHQVVVEGRARQSCNLTAYGFGDAEAPLLPDMLDRVVLGAEDILGAPPEMRGGPVFGGRLSDGARLAQMFVWHVPGAGPEGPVLTLSQDPRSVSLSLGRIVPAP